VTRRILVQLFSLRAQRAPLVIVIEDAHWLDSASWALLEELRQAACPLLLLVSLRSGEPVDEPAYARLRQAASVEHLHLDVLSRAQIRELLDHLLGGVAVSEELVDTLYGRTDGHPFFTEELFYTLRDRGALVVEDGRCVLRSTPGDSRTLDCTESINAAITSRLTRLGTVEQLTLKIASAIGDHISIPLWRSVALAVGVRDEISSCIAHLCDLEFMREVIRGEVVAFKHAITRGVVYDMLTYAQREAIHGAIVRAYERTADVNSGAIAAVIATHCANAKMFSDAVDRYEVASGLALASGAYREAASHASSAQHLTRAHELAVDPLRLARWEHLRGEAEFQSGHLNQARQHFHKALVLLGRAGADGKAQVFWDMSACTARHLLRDARRAPILDARPSPERDQTLDADTLAALLYERLARLHYFAGDSIEFTHYALRCLDVCERLPASLELAKSYAGAALLAASTPGLRMLSPRYARRARDVATRLARRAAVGEIELILATSAAGDGRWDEAANNVAIALANFEQLSELQSIGHCRFLMLKLCLYQGRLTDARRELQHLADLGAAGNLQLGASSVSMGTWIDRRQGAFESLLALAESIDSARMQEASQAEPSVLGSTRANIAYAYARAGQIDQAEHLVDIVLHGRRGRASPVFHAIELWFPLADTLVLLWQHAGDAIGHPLYAQKLDMCLRVMRALARRHRITRPAYLLSRGLAGLRLRRHRDAAACFTKCAALSDRLAMPIEAGRAYLELARLEADPARRGAAAAQAEQRFSLTGTTADLDAVRALPAQRADQRTPGTRERRQ
jgi:tetratricopeptide (TPR) repeat protein